MPSQGPSSPTTAINNSDLGIAVWNNPTNCLASDDAYAVANLPAPDWTMLLEATGFGFSIPGGATINGVLVEIERHCDSASVKDREVQLLLTGVQQGNDKADTVTTWPGTDAYAGYGGSSDTWGATLTPAIVNDSTFGVRLQAQSFGMNDAARVDHIRVTVWYTPGAAGGSGIERPLMGVG
jgi:hypothetical protein